MSHDVAIWAQPQGWALPASLEPSVVYEIAVVKGTKHARQAQAFVAGLAAGAGRHDLLAAGFGRPPVG